MEARLVPVPAPAPEPVLSPELVLVDPELAAWAKPRLEPPGSLVRAVLAERHRPPRLRLATVPGDSGPTPRSTVARPSPSMAQLLPPAGSRPLRRQSERRRGAARAVLLAAIATGIGFAAGRTLSPDALDGGPVRSSTAATSAGNPVAREAPSPRPSGRTAGSPATGAARPPAPSQDESDEAVSPPTATAPSAGSTSPAASGTRRELAWLPVAGASHYRVELYRGKRQILVAFAGEPRLTIAGTWRHGGATASLEPGVYRWIVRPGFGPRGRARYGAPTVSSTLRIRP